MADDKNIPTVEDTGFATSAQTHLIKACLSTDREQAAASLSLWKKQLDLDDVDAGSLRLLPLLSKQLAALQIEDLKLAFYKGVYKKSWVKNKRLFHQLVNISDVLKAAEIPFLVLKGTALTALYYQDSGTRPMDDLDILVPEEYARQTIQLFEEKGWQSRHNIHQSFIEKHFELYKHLIHSIDLESAEGFSLDIHWKPFTTANSTSLNSGAWDNCQSFTLNGTEFRTVSAEFQLLHTIMHGIRWNEVPAIRWIVDAAFILKTEGNKFNWDNFIKIAMANKVPFFIAKAIDYLGTLPGIFIPQQVQKKIAALPVVPGDEKEYTAMRSAKGRYYFFYNYWIYYLKLRANTPEWSAIPFFSGYVSFVRIKTNMTPISRSLYPAAKLMVTGKR